MTRFIVGAVTILAAVGSAAAAGSAASTELDRLRAENRRLGAALAERERQVRALQRELGEMAAALRRLEARIAKLQTLVGQSGAPAAPASGQATRELDIRVAKDDWGDSTLIDIEKVLRSAAEELWAFFPDRKLKPIVVRRSRSGPIVLYQRGPGGEYIVKLDSQNRLWSQMTYQFAHELCHILTNYCEKTPRQCKWFEESVCEMASLFALRRMAKTWRTRPPWPNWRSYAPALQSYADDCLKRTARLPENTTLAQWYRSHAKELQSNPNHRDRNKVVAAALLPLFEKSPESWEAVGYLNLGRPEEPKTFEEYLAKWRRDAPAGHRPFVEQIISLFGVEVPQMPPPGPPARSAKDK